MGYEFVRTQQLIVGKDPISPRVRMFAQQVGQCFVQSRPTHPEVTAPFTDFRALDQPQRVQ